MTNEEMERAIEFLLEHHAKFSTDIEHHSEQINQLTKAVATLTGDVQALTGGVQALTGGVQALTGNVEAMREEMREGFNKLILANEVTRKLAEDVARLAVQTSQRVTGLEGRVSDLEVKQ